MERVAFLIEETNDQIRCLLNPEALVIHRLAGVRQRQSISGPLTGKGLADDPLLYTGGGRMEIHLDLLFDCGLAGSSIVDTNVRALTAPFWNLAENSLARGYGQPPQVRFLWGKFWDIPGIVVAVSERLEQFTADGTAQRSWMRMRLLRVDDSSRPLTVVHDAAPAPTDFSTVEIDRIPEQGVRVHEIIGGGIEPAERIPTATGPPAPLPRTTQATPSPGTPRAGPSAAGPPAAGTLIPATPIQGTVNVPASATMLAAGTAPGLEAQTTAQAQPLAGEPPGVATPGIPVATIGETIVEESRVEPTQTHPVPGETAATEAPDVPAATAGETAEEPGVETPTPAQPLPGAIAGVETPNQTTPAAEQTTQGSVGVATPQQPGSGGPMPPPIPLETLPDTPPPPRPETPAMVFGERLDQLAFRYYGDPRYWRLLAIFNGIDDPIRILPGLLLRVPPATAMKIR